MDFEKTQDFNPEVLIASRNINALNTLEKSQKKALVECLWERNSLEDILYYKEHDFIKYQDIHKRLNELWKEDAIKQITHLRANHVINNYEIFSFIVGAINQNSKANLDSIFNMFKPYIEKDGLNLSITNEIDQVSKDFDHQSLAKDSTLDFLKRCITLTITFDYNKLFYYCFLDNRKPSEITHYLLDNFKIDEETIKSVEYYISIHYKQNDPLVERLLSKGMQYIAPPLKKTKVVSEFHLQQHESISGEISFINSNVVALNIYDSKTKQSRLDIYHLADDCLIASLQLDIKAFSSIEWCAWREGLAVLSEKTLVYIPLNENVCHERVLLTDEKLIHIIPCENPKMIAFEVTNDRKINTQLTFQYPLEINYLSIKSLNDNLLLIHFSSPRKRYGGRALGLVQIEGTVAKLLNIYKEVDEPEVVKELGIGSTEASSYIYLDDVTYFKEKIWCFTKGSSLINQLGLNYPYKLLTNYHCDVPRASSPDRTPIKTLFSLLNREKRVSPDFSWSGEKINLSGERLYFSDNGAFIVNHVANKNRLFIYNTGQNTPLLEVRITKAQSLKSINLKDARIIMFNDKKFIVHDRNTWNVCKVID